MTKFSHLDFSKARILVIGDVMLDRYWHGDTSRISPEAPVPVVKIESHEDRLGGAANVALNISALGAQATLVGIIGQDEVGDKIKTLLKAQGVCDAMVEVKAKSITKLRVMGRHQQLLRCDFEEDFAPFQTQLLETIKPLMAQTDIIILSDYAKGTLKNPQPLIEMAKAHQVRVLVDPKSKDFGLYAGADCITPNQLEFEQALGVGVTPEGLGQKAATALEKYDFQGILLTKGAQGMSFFSAHTKTFHVPALAREVYDITGAGDTVIATLATALAAGFSWQEAIELANRAAGIAVGKLGTATVLTEELLDHLNATDLEHCMNESEQALSMQVRQWKSQGKTIVMTNGCFDILHTGHVRYLKQARALGDKLIVAVNDDASVTALKGPTRPIYPLLQRLEMLASLACVDAVVAFSESTPLRLIERLVPNILVKGGDYKADDVVGADCVKKHGGRVVILDLVPGCSTSNTLKHLEEEAQTLGAES